MMGSNIHPLFLKGDQRRYFIPCTCCGERIPCFGRCLSRAQTERKGWNHYKLDNHGHLVTGSVGYICQMCGGSLTIRGNSNKIWPASGEKRQWKASPDSIHTTFPAFTHPLDVRLGEICRDYVRRTHKMPREMKKTTKPL